MRIRARIIALALGSVLAALPAALPAVAKTPVDQLVVGFSMTNLLTLDPASITGRESVQVLANIYDNLVSLDPVNRATVNPGLAESWTLGEDKRTLTFKLRKGVKFHSGNPVTAADVVFSLTRVLKVNQSQSSYWKAHGITVENAGEVFTAPDAETVVLRLPQPTDPQIILYTLGIVGCGSVVDTKVVQQNQKGDDLGAAWLNTNSAGSGAFVLRSWRSNEVLILDRAAAGNGPQAALKRIVMRHIPESQNQRLMLERGDIDIGYTLAAPDLVALKSAEGVKVQSSAGSGYYYIAASMKDPTLANPKVRLAIRSLIDYEALNRTIMPFYGVLHERPIQKGFLGALPDPGYALDPAKAKALLAEAGFPGGIKVTLRTLSEAPFVSLATAIQASLAQGGIQAEIVTGSGDQVYGAMRRREFQLLVGRGGGGQIPHPDSNLRSMVYNPDNRDEAKLTNYQGWRTAFFDADLNRMIETALVEPDKAKQEAMYRQIQERYAGIVPAIQPISEVVDSLAYRSDIQNLVINPAWSTDLSVVSKTR
ncbi:MAG: ABC transporter substrate-binding protein [Microvirga sp.]